MFKNALVIVTAMLLASASVATFARSGGGSSGHSGGMSSQHISSKGLKNTNGPDAADRDKGLQRAEDRRSKEGLAHEKADKAHGKHKHHGSSKTRRLAVVRRG